MSVGHVWRNDLGGKDLDMGKHLPKARGLRQIKGQCDSRFPAAVMDLPHHRPRISGAKKSLKPGPKLNPPTLGCFPQTPSRESDQKHHGSRLRMHSLTFLVICGFSAGPELRA